MNKYDKKTLLTLAKKDLAGLAKAFAESDIQWHENEWKELLDAYATEFLKEILPEEKKIPESEDFGNAIFNILHLVRIAEAEQHNKTLQAIKSKAKDKGLEV